METLIKNPLTSMTLVFASVTCPRPEVRISHLIPNAKFEKQKFAAITIRLGQPVCTVLLFTSGKMVLTGCKSMLDCILASNSVYYYLRAGFPGVHFVLETVKIQNIVGNALLSLPAGCHLDLLRFYEMYNIYCTYQPSMFPGLIYRQSDLPIVLLIFYSGKVVITRAKCMLDVYEGWGKVLKLLQNFMTESDTDKNNVSAGSQSTHCLCDPGFYPSDSGCHM